MIKFDTDRFSVWFKIALSFVMCLITYDIFELKSSKLG